MGGGDQAELCERVAVLESKCEADAEERKERRGFLDQELDKILKAIDDLKDWVRVQLYGNGTKEGCLDERLKRVERFVDAFDWRKAWLGRIVAYAIQGLLLVILLKLLKLA